MHECVLGHQSLRVCEVSYTYLQGCLRYSEKHGKDLIISCGCLLLFTNIKLSFKHVSDGVSTWAKFDGHIYHGYPVICEGISPL